MTLISDLARLQKEGCFPSIYCRGDVWRAHVNIAGNYWADDSTPTKAMASAVILWHQAGRPMDGRADEVAVK